MALSNVLLNQGYVPAGATPKTIVEPGGEAGYYDTSRLGNLLRNLDKVQKQRQAEVEKQQKEFKRQTDMYKVLRDAGYSPEKATKAVKEGKLLVDPGESEEDKLKREKTQAEIDKIKSQTKSEEDLKLERNKAKADLFKTQTETQKTLSEIGGKKPKIQDKIMEKIATKGEESLTKGEKKVYDEVIRKYGAFGDMVPVEDPKGAKLKVKRADLEKAIKKGYKIRWDDL